MTDQKKSLYQTAIQKMASLRPVSWFFARTLHHLDWIMLKLSGKRATLTSLLTGLPVVVVTTTGAKSGLPRTLPLLCIRTPEQPEQFALIASNFGQRHNTGWYFNLKKNPRADCLIQGQTRMYTAHEASEEEYEKYWQRAQATYIGFPLYKQRAGKRRIPIMVLEPENKEK